MLKVAQQLYLLKMRVSHSALGTEVMALYSMVMTNRANFTPLSTPAAEATPPSPHLADLHGSQRCWKRVQIKEGTWALFD